MESDRDVYSHPPSSTYFWKGYALEDHEDTVSIGGRTITNLRFADVFDSLAGEEEELAKLVVSTKPPKAMAWRSVLTRPSS